jgi:glycosyltransferase involved in cell wall biosynthesis
MLLENNPYPWDPRVRHEAESLVAAGHSVEVIAPRAPGEAARERVNGVDVRRFRAINWPRGGTAAMLLEYLVAWFALHAAAIRALAHGSTVLHLHNPPDMLFLAGAMFRVAGREVVFDHHDLGPELADVRFGRGVLAGVARVSERLTFAVASHVLAANESHAEIARGRGRMGSKDVTVVRNGPPASWTRLPIQIRDGVLAPIRLAYLGTVAEQDGLDGIAEVLSCLGDRTPAVDVVLTVIGDGDARGKFEAALERWGVADKVRMKGWVAPDQVPALLQDADVCVDPAPATALNERSTMIKLMEYLALGKPVVAYDLLESRRTVRDAAMLVEPGDVRAFAERIAMLAEDPALRSRLAHRARDRARELTWETSEVALLGVYREFGGDATPR